MRTEGPLAPPRILIDSNLYLSYLLSPIDRVRHIVRLVESVPDGFFQLVLPEEVIAEVIGVVLYRSYFRQRVTEQEARDAMAELCRFADIPPRISEIPRIVRDPKDDYLLAYAILERVDFLVIGDRDLLALDGEIEQLRIVTAAEFLKLLDEPGAEP